MRRLAVTASTGALFTISTPTVALACTACGDHAVRITHPWVVAAAASLTLWGVVTAILGVALDGKVRGKPAPLPSRRLTGALVLLALVGAIAGALGLGSNYLAQLGVGVVLGLVVLGLTIRSLLARPVPKPSVAIAALHALFVGLACWNGWSAQRSANTPEHLVSLLRYEVPLVAEVVVPQVVALGDAAVPLLEERARTSLARENPRPAAYYLFPLEAIRTPAACAALERLVATRPEPSDPTLRLARFAWARCGEKAVQQLMESYPGAPDERRRVDLLAALLRSGQPRAVLFAIDHLEVLEKSADPLARESRWLLEQATTAKQLETIHVYPRRILGGPPRPGYSAVFYGRDDAPAHKGVPASELRAKWEGVFGARGVP